MTISQKIISIFNQIKNFLYPFDDIEIELNNCNINIKDKIKLIKNKPDYRDKKNDLEGYETIEKLLIWCKKRNININFSSKETTKYLVKKRTIIINDGRNIFKQVCGILHECGHAIIIDENLKIPNINPRKYSSLLEVVEKNKKFDNFKEEVFAWEKAFELSKILNINLNIDDYIRYRDSCLETYSKKLNKF